MTVDPVEVADGDRGEVHGLAVGHVSPCDDGVAQVVLHRLKGR